MTAPTTDGELELFLTCHLIQQRVREMGAEISRDFRGRTLVLVGVLKGASIFLADLARAISVDCTFDFVSISTYGAGTRSPGGIGWMKDIELCIEDKNVLLIEDILDTGVTLRSLQDRLLALRPETLRTVVLLDKPSRRLQPVEADYTGFTIPDRFVVGYGMDLDERYRNLPDIYFLPVDIQEE